MISTPRIFKTKLQLNIPLSQKVVIDNSVHKLETMTFIIHNAAYNFVTQSFEIDKIINEWVTNNEEGKWVMDHCINQVEIHDTIDSITFEIKIGVRGMFFEKDATFYRLKWG